MPPPAVRTVTLAADQVTTVTGPAASFSNVAVWHRGNVTQDVYATTNGADPAPDGNDVYAVPSGDRRRIARAVTGNSVKLLSAGAAKVEVEFA